MATVTLSWTDNDSNEYGFRIYRSTTDSPTFDKGNGDYTQIQQIAVPDTTSYTDQNAPSGDFVHYAVTAYNAAGESGATTSTIRTLNQIGTIKISKSDGTKYDVPIYSLSTIDTRSWFRARVSDGTVGALRIVNSSNSPLQSRDPADDTTVGIEVQ